MEWNDFSDLDAARAHAWSLLAGGAGTPGASMHRAVLATRGLDDLPNARTMLLWRADVARRLLYFHGDARSPKHAELKRAPWALIVFYSPEADTQLRLHASIHVRRDDALVRRAWDELRPETRCVFATQQPPGHASADPPAEPPTDAEQAGYENFVLLEAKVMHLDWLLVAQGRHRRAGFTWDAADVLHATWLYP